MSRRDHLRFGRAFGPGATLGGTRFLTGGIRRAARDGSEVDMNSLPDWARNLGPGWVRRIGAPLDDPGRVKPALIGQIRDDGYWQGLPLGGFGSGSIGRTYRGDFARWHLDVGRHHYETVPANQFSVYVDDGRDAEATVLCAGKPEGVLGSWQWDYPAGAGVYHALFPKAQFVYDPDIVGVDLAMKQFSPIIPHNYRETSYPVGIFEATATNNRSRTVTVTVMFTWQNTVGCETWNYCIHGDYNRKVEEDAEGGRVVGVVLGTQSNEIGGARRGEFCLAAKEVPGTSVTFRTRFKTGGDGWDLWEDFVDDGRLNDEDDQRPAEWGENIGAAVAITFRLEPGQTKVVPFALSWDFPAMQFGWGVEWYKRYTKFYGTSGDNSFQICKDALEEYRDWEAEIDAWQRPILADPTKPDWYKAALFNELYYLVDGGTAWENGRVGDLEPGEGKFTYLECFDYPFYSTLDVRFYSSFALLMLWPELEKQELCQFADTVNWEDLSPVTITSNGSSAVRKKAGAIPHDLGNPWESPWLKANSYTWQDINIWKDLNSKFVLMVYRDYVALGDRSLVDYCWPAVKSAIAYLKEMDKDGDGLPENEGVPDQTYDTWPMKGASAYCGGLWLASLRAGKIMAEIEGDRETAELYDKWFHQALASYERLLWNGEYYNYDAAGNGHSDSIMADQLAGQWYAQVCGLPNIVPQDHVLSVLRKVYEYNLLGFKDGMIGAVNGIRPDGSMDRTCEQSEEVWTGTNYALAGFMIQNGLEEEALRLARGIYRVTYETRGYWFRTPEAWDEHCEFRASLYMRPQAIWAMQYAYEKRRNRVEG
ncbi:MAG: glucosylceramidase [Chloroflexi bacterium]|nr:glucosylceramidase [Chloroflexota bacterium]